MLSLASSPLILLALALGTGAFAAASGANEGPPNIVVILLDDVGVDRVGAYGAHPNPGRTPTLDALCQAGAMFRNAWSMPLCSPTRASLLTGRYPSRHGVGSQIQAHNPNSPQLDPAEIIIPEGLRSHSNRVVGKWHLKSYGEPNTHPLDTGFDGHVGSLYNLNATGYWNWRKFTDGQYSNEPNYATSVTTNDALTALIQLPEPRFLYVAYNAAHGPFHVPPAHLHSYGQPADDPMRFRAMAEAMDTELAQLVAAIDLSNTFLFLVGDNGTPKAAVDAPNDPNHAKATLYEGGVNVPLIVLGPGVQAGERQALVGVTDLFATIMELTSSPSTAVDSISFVDVLYDANELGDREFLYAEMFGPFSASAPPLDRAIRTRRFKWMNSIQGPQLYDLQLDPLELNNLIADPAHQNTVARLVAALPTFL